MWMHDADGSLELFDAAAPHICMSFNPGPLPGAVSYSPLHMRFAAPGATFAVPLQGLRLGGSQVLYGIPLGVSETMELTAWLNKRLRSQALPSYDASAKRVTIREAAQIARAYHGFDDVDAGEAMAFEMFEAVNEVLS